MKLLSEANPKIQKGAKLGYLTFILHLAPGDLSGKEVCPKRTAGCTLACLNTAGRGGMFRKGETTNVIQQARIRKTKWFFSDRDAFLVQLKKEIRAGIAKARKLGLIPVFRLNGTSDLSWEKYGVIQEFPDIQFYDYTKVLGRKVSHLPNYHLTFSRSETNDAEAVQVLKAGGTVAVVFRDGLPKTWNGFPVVNGDASDLRHRDPKGVVVGLVAKGEGKKDTSGFVVDLPFGDLVYRPPVGAAEKDLYKAGAEYDIAMNRYMLKRKPSKSALEKVVGKNPKATLLCALLPTANAVALVPPLAVTVP